MGFNSKGDRYFMKNIVKRVGHNERGGLVKRKITFNTWGVNSSLCACMCV